MADSQAYAQPDARDEAAVHALVDRYLDRAYLAETLLRLGSVPTDVPLGHQTLIEPDDPKLVFYVQEVLRPELVRLGYYDLLDAPRNNLVVRLGAPGARGALLIQNYTPIQHHQLMERPFSPRIASARDYGVDEPAVFAQGVSQNKGHQAVMLAVLKLLRDSGAQPRGRVFWAINNEGRSSHACSEAIIGALDERPAFGILQNRTALRVSLGNRGRLDLNVHVRGKATHSSQPQAGLSAIEGANEVINRLRKLAWAETHPQLGAPQLSVYKLRFEPLAPHTLPADAYLTLDRRMLPGEDQGTLVEEVRAAIGDLAPYEVTVTPGVAMLPALVDADEPGVRALQAAHRSVHGREAECFYGQGTFDAGGPCALGVPTVMYGASGGDWPLGVDFVPLAAVEAEARVLARLILGW
jgi:acetylornithine deacetylase/succinyl-diaminopimelate desuccinylase-like protein